MECYRFGTFFFRKYIQHLLKKGDIRWSNKEICWSNNDMCLFDQLIRPARAAFAPLSPSQNTGQSEKNIFRTCRKTQIFIRLLTLAAPPRRRAAAPPRRRTRARANARARGAPKASRGAFFMECYRFGTVFFRKYIQHLLKKGDIRWSNKEICWSNNDMCLFDQLIRPARAAFAPVNPSQNTGQSEKNKYFEHVGKL